jgi:hypothetical protein
MYKKITIAVVLIGVGVLIGTRIENFEFALELKKRNFG